MAEAIINDRLGNRWLAYSAGTRPVGYVHPKAVQVLNEIGINHSGRSKHANEFRDVDLDLVVTVCDSAAEDCPVWLGKGRVIHHSFPDPAIATGTNEKILDVFRSVRDSITREIISLMADY
jgi:arsenate reductase